MNKTWSVFRWQLSCLSILGCCAAPVSFAASDLTKDFVTPPDSARPGVYWYFMGGSISREGITRDLESMKQAGLGHALFLQIGGGESRVLVSPMSEQWRELFAHAVHEADRLGMEIMLATGPGWTGAGGPWVKPEDAMQHLVASRADVTGPGPFAQTLPVPPPYGTNTTTSFFKDVCVLAFPTPSKAEAIPFLSGKALYKEGGGQPRPHFEIKVDYPALKEGVAIPMDKIIDLTSKLLPDGSLDWQVPVGNWTVMRFVSRDTGRMNSPAPGEGYGLECDKWSAEALHKHLENYTGKLLQKVGSQHAWNMLHSDSWEEGAQNWTPKFREEFKKRRGYDPQPFYPCYTGLFVDSRERTERFLWDLRQTGSELMVENYAGALKSYAHKNGMSLSTEPYGAYPGNDFDLGAVADLQACEFWYTGNNSSIEEAPSIAHVMGRSVVGAESFTSGNEDWQAYPANMKNQGDWAFSLGVNRFTYHTYAHHPDESRPGVTMWQYGVHWDRGQTWWPMADAYHRYISRCSEMLRQGRWVADVLYLTPEGAPNVFLPPDSASDNTSKFNYPERKGYNYDCCSASALIKLAGVRNGSVVFPGGASYRLLVLPNRSTMTPELAAKLESLIRKGATVVGPAPRKSPSLVNFPRCDDEVAATAKKVWGTWDAPAAQTERAYGKGRVIWGGVLNGPVAKELPTAEVIDLYPPYDLTAAILKDARVPEDFMATGPVRYARRSTADREIYFVANRSGKPVQADCVFRVAGHLPELWHPVTGEMHSLPEFKAEKNTTAIPLRFEPYESYFVIFPKTPLAASSKAKSNFADTVSLATLEGAWDVAFDPALGGPAQIRFEKLEDWTQRPEEGIKYYSGLATYRKTFDLPKAEALNGPVLLDLGVVNAMARVRLNGQDCGVAWTAPWRVDITKALKPTGNALEIEVANLWPNLMLGDAKHPDRKPYAQTTYHPYAAGQPRANDPLLASGLLGPVTVRADK
jgi:hypothetical protein